MDAKRWAKEFCEITGFEDEELMLTWFANSIMCGWDNAHWKADKLALALEVCAKSTPATDPTGRHFDVATKALRDFRGEK